jgi:hypothetical protein
MGTEVLKDFATKTYRYLVNEEEKRIDRPSDLRVFCRLDISIFLNNLTNQHEYFVSEIVTTHRAALFLPYMDGPTTFRFAADYAATIRAWVAMHRSHRAAQP